MIIIIIIIIINIIMSMGLPNTPSRSKHAGGNHPTHTTPQGVKGGNHQSPHPNHTTPQGGGKQPTTTPHRTTKGGGKQPTTTGGRLGGTIGGGGDGRTGIIYIYNIHTHTHVYIFHESGRSRGGTIHIWSRAPWPLLPQRSMVRI